MIKLLQAQDLQLSCSRAVLFTKESPTYTMVPELSSDEQAMADKMREAKKPIISFYKGGQFLFLSFLEQKPTANGALEWARKCGATLAAEVKSHKISEIVLSTDADNQEILLAFAEGLALASYQFGWYKKEVPVMALETIYINGPVGDRTLAEMEAVIAGTLIARDLVNVPSSHQTAEQLSESIRETGKEAGFKVEVLNKNKIEALKMGGLLSVAMGSIDPPTFNILEWRPDKAVNEKPIVLVGKGVVFDTGGLTLKPTPNSMDLMKSDMAGAAAVTGAFYAIAKAKLPYYVIGLIPATDNRPGEKATAPGDVITMYDGTTVEVLNTDAEGRLILGDALHYAKKYDPDIVIDLATLTGAAARAIGQYGIVYMSNADDHEKNILKKSGEETYERVVELPLWDEYADLIKSDISDLKNVAAGTNAGAITAGKFLEHFTDYPWIHLDIAGPAFINANDTYRTKNATGVGVRLLLKYITNRYAHA